jgi:type IV pilus assembly protein PilW
MGVFAMKRGGMQRHTIARGASSKGFTLIELMVALTLGLLLSFGIVTLFGATSKTNKVQDSLARLQENGRYAMIRMNADLRMLGGQYCNSKGSQGWIDVGAGGPQYPGAGIYVNASGVSQITSSGAFPDSGGTAGLAPPGHPAGTVYPLSPVAFLRGYECAADGSCVPTAPTGAAADGIPDAGTTAGARVPLSDVLTIRYQRGTGWPYAAIGSGTGAVIDLQPTMVGGTQVDDPVNFAPGDHALITSCGGGQIFTTSTGGSSLTAQSLLNPTAFIPGTSSGSFDARVFNFDKDFVTVTYYLQYKNDPNPDQPGRLIPVLMRKVNGSATPDEIVQGVERLDFTYGVQFRDGSFQYLTADQIEADSDTPAAPPALPVNCPPPPPQWDTTIYNNVEPHCLWRAVKSIQVNMLLDSVDNVYDLALADTTYRYTVDDPDLQTPQGAPTDDMLYNGVANGTKTGRMMRREFVSMVAARNSNY